MKKLNITKKQYDESKYFNKKYGALKFVSESGKLYKTDKGVVIALEGTERTDESISDIGKAIGDTLKGGAEKVKSGFKKAAKAVGDLIHGTFRENDPVTISGKRGDVEAIVGDTSLGGNEIILKVVKPVDESTESDEEDNEKSTEVLGDVLAGVIDAVKDVADKNGIELPDEDDDKKDDDEDDEEKDDDKDDDDKDDDEEKDDDDLLRDGELELTDEEEELLNKECGLKEECGDGCDDGACLEKECLKESARRRRARLVREAIQRRAKARKIGESIERRARARKVLESIRAKRRRAKVMESLRKRRAARKVMESIRRRRAAKRVMESRRRRAK